MQRCMVLAVLSVVDFSSFEFVHLDYANQSYWMVRAIGFQVNVKSILI